MRTNHDDYISYNKAWKGHEITLYAMKGNAKNSYKMLSIIAGATKEKTQSFFVFVSCFDALSYFYWYLS